MPVAPLGRSAQRGAGDGLPGSSPGAVPGSLPCVLHRPFVAPQAVAALEREHRAELQRLSSSREAKHREVRGSALAWEAGPGCPGP